MGFARNPPRAREPAASKKHQSQNLRQNLALFILEIERLRLLQDLPPATWPPGLPSPMRTWTGRWRCERGLAAVSSEQKSPGDVSVDCLIYLPDGNRLEM